MIDEVLGDLVQNFIKEEYKKIAPIFLFLVAILSPATIFAIVYRRDVFYELDLLKMVFAFLIINCLIIVVSFWLSYISTISLVQSRIAVEKSLKNAEEMYQRKNDSFEEFKDKKMMYEIKSNGVTQ